MSVIFLLHCITCFKPTIKTAKLQSRQLNIILQRHITKYRVTTDIYQLSDI